VCDEELKPLRGVPPEAHRIAIGGAIFSGSASIFGDKPREHFAKNGVGVFHANLFLELPERDRNKVEEGINERRVHVDDIVASFLGQAVRCFDGRADVCVGSTGIICWKMRVPVRHLSSSKLECRPNELARGHFGRASKYSVAINSFVHFIS